MKKRMRFMIGLVVMILLMSMVTMGMSGCDTQASRVSDNLSQEADSFNVVRRLTVINCIQGDILFQMEGKMSITADPADNQLEVTVEDESGNYQKHFIGLSDNVTYTVEQLRAKNVDNYKYTINFNPKMWMPVGIGTVD